jgi:hypothetical protein
VDQSPVPHALIRNRLFSFHLLGVFSYIELQAIC